MASKFFKSLKIPSQQEIENWDTSPECQSGSLNKLDNKY